MSTLIRDPAVIKRVSEHLDHYRANSPNDWVGIFLAGSQNYGLDYESSDVDTKVIVLPTLKEVAMMKPMTSHVLVMPNNEHVEVKDVRLMFDCYRKQNINFVETLFTRYSILNPRYAELFQSLLSERETIARYNNYSAMSCMLGAIRNKHKSLTKPTPASADIIQKYGYEGKQLHHMERLLEFMKRYVSGEPYADCLISKQREYLISLKKNELPCPEALQRAKRVVDEAVVVCAEYMRSTPRHIRVEVEALMDKVQLSLISECLTNELCGCVRHVHE